VVDFQDALNRLRGYRDSGDASALPKFLSHLDIALLMDMCKEWPNSFFDGLLSLLEDPKFLALEESWNLLDFLNGNWDVLCEEQRERLRPILAAAFDEYGNWMGAFLTAEILGEHYTDEETLAVLKSLSRTAKLPARPLVPHGLVYLARATADERLRSSAVEQLRHLSRSENEEVREEAIIGLRDLDIEI
jgi:hypothetical protein